MLDIENSSITALFAIVNFGVLNLSMAPENLSLLGAGLVAFFKVAVGREHA